LNRENGFGSIIIPNTIEEIELYFAFDSINEPANFGINKLAFGYEDDDGFHESTNIEMSVLNNPLEHYGIIGTLVKFTHKVDINFSELALIENEYFMRVSVQDGINPIVEIPTNNGLYFIKEYMSFNRTD